MPFSGTRFFCVGGACNNNAYGEAFQTIDLSTYTSQIDAATVSANYGVMMRNWSGNDDRPEMRVKAVDQAGNLPGTSPVVGTLSRSWLSVQGNRSLPAGTCNLRVELRAHVMWGLTTTVISITCLRGQTSIVWDVPKYR